MKTIRVQGLKLDDLRALPPLTEGEYDVKLVVNGLIMVCGLGTPTVVDGGLSLSVRRYPPKDPQTGNQKEESTR